QRVAVEAVAARALGQAGGALLRRAAAEIRPADAGRAVVVVMDHRTVCRLAGVGPDAAGDAAAGGLHEAAALVEVHAAVRLRHRPRRGVGRAGAPGAVEALVAPRRFAHAAGIDLLAGIVGAGGAGQVVRAAGLLPSSPFARLAGTRRGGIEIF